MEPVWKDFRNQKGSREFQDSKHLQNLPDLSRSLLKAHMPDSKQKKNNLASVCVEVWNKELTILLSIPAYVGGKLGLSTEKQKQIENQNQLNEDQSEQFKLDAGLFIECICEDCRDCKLIIHSEEILK